jgi:protein-L-isoaspartate(D-aspartate) O-methyltransferase
MDPERLRREMVDRQIADRGVRDPRVLEAMRQVPRELFVPGAAAHEAYEDHPLGIGEGQTISQPYVVALMAEAAQVGPEDRVLEVGAGSGYGAAVLGCLAHEVWTLERHHPLAEQAARALDAAAAANVTVVHADGTAGWPQRAPYDAIVVTAAGHDVPRVLVEQLAEGGRLVMPVGDASAQELVRLRRSGDSLTRDELGAVRFVPLLPDLPPG